MLYAATLMDLKIIILSEVSQRQISYDITCRWNLTQRTYLQNINRLIHRNKLMNIKKIEGL